MLFINNQNQNNNDMNTEQIEKNIKIMKDLLLKFRNEIRSNSKIGKYEELLILIEKEIDRLDTN